MKHDVLDPAALKQLRDSFHGEIVLAGDPAYESVRTIWNAMIERRPKIIARCSGVADVIAAVKFARNQTLDISVRAGGHNVAGFALCEGGLMIDLSMMRAVHVDPSLGRVTVEGGATWGDVDRETTLHDRAIPGGVISATGVGGLTLSGGIGWLRGKHGLSIDNLLAANVVLADGRYVRASESENADLLWALKGGGGNFGIVTVFEFRIHPIETELYFCGPSYPESRASEIIPQWREFMKSAPEGLTGLCEFSTLPHDEAFPAEARGQRVVSLAHVYDGPADKGERITRPLRGYGEPLVDFSGAMPYRTIQSLYDSLFPKGRDRCYWKSLYLNRLDETVLADILTWLERRPSEMTYASIWHFGGAVSRVAPDATAFGARTMPYMLSIDGIWSRAEEDEANLRWVKDFWSAMQAYSDGRLYLNFPGHGEDHTLASRAYGERNYARLQGIKRQYDPTNFFHNNQNITPA